MIAVETVRAAGLNANRQIQANSLQEALDWIDGTLSHPIVVKPANSAGSDCVFKCSTEAELKMACDSILTETNCLGLVNDRVLVQDFLQGTEYVIDCVSFRGQHRVAQVFRYDKRPKNGRSFVYFSLQVVDPRTDSKAMQCVEYTFQVLDALGIAEGISHSEVIFDSRRGPTLVETGARPHGGDGSWIPVAESCSSCTCLSMLADLVQDLIQHETPRFLQLPRLPPLHRYGAEVYFVSQSAGSLQSIRADLMRQFASFHSIFFFEHAMNRVIQSHLELGTSLPLDIFIPVTTDCLSMVGCCRLVHSDAEVLERDIASFHVLNDDQQLLIINSS